MNATIPPPPQPLPTTPRMTAEEFGLKHAGEHVEYVNGEVREVPMSGEGKHGKSAGEWHSTSPNKQTSWVISS